MGGIERAPQEVTAAELLRIREDAWSRRLRAVSLVAEDPANRDHTEQTLGVLGRMYRVATSGWDKRRILRRWPAVHVLSTVSVATDHYEHGTFWPKLCQIGRLPNGQAVQSDWGCAFLDNLDSLDLPNFADSDDAGAKFVGRILLHSGVPTYCLGDYFNLVIARRRRVQGIAPDEFVSWAAARAVEGRLYGVDKPVARFLRFGGEYAVDVSDRIFELLDTVAAGGDGAEVPLPERFRIAALSLREAGHLERTRHSRVDSSHDDERAGRVRPHLVLDPYGRGPLLRLPAVSEAPDGLAIWVVTLDARSERVRTQALWPGAHEPAPQTDVPVLTPARVATVAIEGHERHQVTLSIVDDKDPLLAFAEDGRLLPPRLPLPGTSTWLLFPGGANDLQAEGDMRIIAEGALPPGWSGWCLRLIDLSDVSSLTLANSERSRSVRRFSAAQISTGEPIPSVRSRTGSAVFAAPPWISLPANVGEEVSWDLSIIDGDGDVLVHRHFRIGDHPEQIWDELPRPLFGSHRLRLRGPWGRGAVRDIVMAEGLDVRSAPGWRRITPKGLTTATALVTTPAGMDADRDRIELGEQQTEFQLNLTVRGNRRTFIVTPSHMSMSYQSSDVVTAPSIRPIPLHTEDILRAPGTLTVDVGAGAEPVLHLPTATGSVQTVPPAGGSRDGVFRFDLSRIVDTLASHPHTRLALDPGGELTVASVRPRRLSTGVEISGSALHFSDCVDAEGLTAIVYPVRAPWRGGHVLPVSGGSVALPGVLVDAGPLLVSLIIEDPWVPAPIPVWPTVGAAFVVLASGFVAGHDGEEAQLSAYLAGVAEFPASIADLSRLWTIVAWLPSLVLEDRSGQVFAACVTTLQSAPTEAIESIGLSRIEPDAIPVALVLSGLLWTGASGPAVDVFDCKWTRRTAVPASLLWTPWMALRRNSVTPFDVFEDARAVCGENFDALLGGTDPCPNAGRFAESADLYVLLDEAHRVQFRTAAAFVPKGMLDADTRALASVELLERRQDPRLKWLTRNARRVLDEIQRLLELLGDTVGLGAVRARMHPERADGWRALPAVSIGLAFVGRYAARDHAVPRGWMITQKRAWADLARIAPELVSIDLIVAELLLASGHANRLQERR